MTDEQERPDVDREGDGRHRRKDDYAPVEIARLSNGAKRNALIQTIAQIVSPIVIVLGLMWWAAKIDTGLAATRADIQDTRTAIRDTEAAVENVRIEAQEAAEDRRKLAEDQARTSEALSATAATVERVNVRLDMLMMREVPDE